MANGNGFTAAEAIEAIRGSKGFVSVAARRLGCTRKTIYNLIERYSSVKEALKDEREQIKDLAESKLLNQIDEENMTAIMFYLKTQGKDRGYVERQEVTGADGDALSIRVVGGVNLEEI